ncbi:MAG TPA: CoA transferase [Dehalococcoidia bacterium]|nr:CoA transferase [Dehalococcoidia bacterium]
MAGPLSGIRVFDLTLAAVGPWTAMLLGQLGANVIKVESPQGDLSRAIPPPIGGMAVLYISCNFNKRGVILDLKRARDREIALKLAATCDVFVENMRAGAVDRLGLGYPALAEINPRLIYCSAAGFGQTGPLAAEGCADPQMQAFGGWTSIQGAPGGRGEMLRYMAHLDVTTATYAVQAILVALCAREQTGRGQKVELSMLESTMALQTTRLAEYFATGQQPEPRGSAAATTVPQQAFRCQDQVYLAVGVVRESQWPALAAALERPDLAADARFATNADRVDHRDALIPELETAFLSKPARWWELRLAEAGVPCSRFWDFETLRQHPQVTANRHLIRAQTPWRELDNSSLPWHFSATPGEIRPGPIPGADTADVLAELGYELAEPIPEPAPFSAHSSRF